MKSPDFAKTLIVPAILYLPFHHALDAYIDPGTGSIIWMSVIGVIAAVLTAIKLFWTQIKSFFRNLFSRSKKSEGPPK